LALHALPGPLVIVAMVIGGALAGSLWAAIPGLLRAYLRTNEILTSLMLNYVAGLLLYYLIYDSTSYWRDLTSASAKVFPTGKSVDPSGFWPQLGLGAAVQVPLGFLAGIVIAVGIWAVTRTSPTGFAMSVIGESPGAATYAGMRTKRTVAGVMLASGAFAGIGGASQIGDFSHTLDPRGLQQAGYGYTGIVVAALGRYNPLAVVVVAFLIGALTNAGFALQGPDFPSGLVGVIEGIILFSVLAGEALSRYRVLLRGSPRVADTASGTPAGEVVAP
jgi:simple sugar transport system permease protein